METLLLGNCLDVMKTMEENSVDSIVTDPPYGLSFMGKKWDYDVPSVEIWTEALRVLKPGGHLLAFSGTRTYHRMVVNIEDAGFEIRDQIAWVYGQGFPKSHDVSKGIDKAAGAVRNVVGVAGRSGSKRSCMAGDFAGGDYMATTPATPEAKQWQGWGTALKPSMEPIVVARKPLDEKTIAQNVLKYGTGAMNIDECRIEINEVIDDPRLGGKGVWKTDKAAKNVYSGGYSGEKIQSSTQGRWPANLIHDGSDEVVKLFPQSLGSGKQRILKRNKLTKSESMLFLRQKEDNKILRNAGSGSAARFFYCAKTSPKERGKENNHPTVKPVDLMKYLCRLVTPKDGIVLDPFMGSGSTGIAAKTENFNFIGIELSEEYYKIAENRINSIQTKNKLSDLL